jgi:hypothetical protein
MQGSSGTATPNNKPAASGYALTQATLRTYLPSAIISAGAAAAIP